MATTPKKTSATNNMPSMIFPSFIDPNILRHLCRELDSDKVEAEFSVRVRFANLVKNYLIIQINLKFLILEKIL